MIFNGDILSGVDLRALLATHTDARRRRHAVPDQGRATRARSAACRPTPTAG